MTVMEKPSSLEADEFAHPAHTPLMALRKGDASVRLPLHWPGMAGRVADAFNESGGAKRRHGRRVERACARWWAGKGKLKQRASLPRRAASGAIDRVASTR
jgi:hypothetical protein